MDTPILTSDTSDPVVAALFGIVARERLARDTNDWETMAGLYWPDSRVRVTWFDGNAADFIARSKESIRPGQIAGFHAITPVRAELAGDRALVESRGQILLRPRVADVECDLTSWCRFVVGLEKRASEWRIAFFDNIYVKDRIDPTEPGVQVRADPELLSGLRASYRWLAYTNQARGIPVPGDLPGDDRPDLVEAFWADSRSWLSAPSS